MTRSDQHLSVFSKNEKLLSNLNFSLITEQTTEQFNVRFSTLSTMLQKHPAALKYDHRPEYPPAASEPVGTSSPQRVAVM